MKLSLTVYVITTDVESNRYLKFLDRWSPHLDPWSIVPVGCSWRGIQPAYLNLRRWNSNFLFNRSLFLSSPEIGCMLSHKTALEYFVRSKGSTHALFLEDDIYPKHDFSLERIYAILQRTESGFIHLGGQDGLKPLFKPTLFAKNSGGGALELNRYFLSFLYRTCCYCVDVLTAAKILRVYEKYNVVADNWAFIRRKAKIKRMILYDMVSHPENLTESLLESTRHGGKRCH